MEVTKIINEKTWANGITGEGDVEILRLARNGLLLVEAKFNEVTYVPKEIGGVWQLVKVLSLRRIADYVGVLFSRASDFMERGICLAPYFQQRTELGSTDYWSVEELDVAIREYVGRKGLTDVEAVLELGITFDSYDGIKKELRHYYDGRVLASVLRAFQQRWIEKPMSHAVRSILFIHQYNRGRSPEDQVHANRCECEGCDLVAIYRCTNPQCGGGLPPKFLCEKHGVFLLEEEKPRAVCPSCSILLRRGELRGSNVKWPDYC